MSRNQLVMLWAGRILSGLCVIFLLFDAGMKAVNATTSVTATVGLGLPEGIVQPMGFLLLVFTALYCIPRTALIGAMFLTAHLGGAVAIFIQQYHGQALYLFPLNFCLLMWAGLVLRDEEVRNVLLRKRSDKQESK